MVLPPADQCDFYELIEAGSPTDPLSSDYCRGGKVVRLPHVQKPLGQFLKKWQFCDLTSVKGQRGKLSWLAQHVVAGPSGPGKNTKLDRFTYAFTYQGGNGHGGARGLAIVPGFGVRAPLTEGWIVPRVTAQWGGGSRTIALDGLYTPSGSRIADWYVAMGAEDPNWAERRFAQEFGLKLRFPSGLGINSLISFRLGYRGALHREVAGGRWVIEGGFGGW
jgi:hypothetical protein